MKVEKHLEMVAMKIKKKTRNFPDNLETLATSLSSIAADTSKVFPKVFCIFKSSKLFIDNFQCKLGCFKAQEN